jgi:hypothetical protein
MDKPFLRTTQGFNQDNFSNKRWLGVVLLIFYMIWLVWFCAMPISQYETASDIQVIRDGSTPILRATFDEADFRVGQTVQLHTEDTTFNAIVQTIEPMSDKRQIIEFQVKNLPDHLDKNATLAVKSGNTTPAKYLFNQIGQDF